MKGAQIETDLVDIETALEMSKVGILPTTELDPIGKRFKMGTLLFESGAEVTREEFLESIAANGLDVKGFSACPLGYKFQRVTVITS